MSDQEPKRVYQTGDFMAYSLGRHFDVEYWYNPWSGQVEAFVGVIYQGEEEAAKCTDTYPAEEGPGIPKITYKKLEDDGKFRVSFAMPKKKKIGYRVALGLAILPLVAGFVNLLLRPKRKGVS